MRIRQLVILMLLVLAVVLTTTVMRREERTILLSVKHRMMNMNTFITTSDEVQQQQQQQSSSTSPAIKTKSSATLKVVQIGANDGSLEGNDDIVRTLLLSNTTDATLVEANPKIFQLLLRTVADTYRNDARITPVNALICPEEQSDLTFYAVNDTRIKADYPSAPHWVLHQLSSLDRASITRGLRGFLASKSRAAAQNMNAYLITIPIPCTPFAKILHQSNLSPESVDVLAVDVEGHDARVLTEAFQVPGFLPRLVVFEAKVVATDFPSELQDVVNLLQQRGYTTDCTMSNEKWKCPGDVLATQGAPVWLNATHCVTQSAITTSCAQ